MGQGETRDLMDTTCRDKRLGGSKRRLSIFAESVRLWIEPRTIALGLIIAVLAVAVCIGHRRFYLGLDSVGHYVQVWFIHQSLFQDGNLPISNPYLESGGARAFPYGFVPYLFTALLYQLFHERAVSAVMALLAASIITIVGFTRLKKDVILTACFALSLPFLDGLLSFQFVFFWAALFFFLFVWSVERGHALLGGVFMWATMVSHPIIGLEGAMVYAAWYAYSHPDRRWATIRMASVAGICAIPPFAYSLGDPSVAEAPKLYLLAKIAIRSTFGLTVLFGPFLLERLRPLIVANFRRVLLTVSATSALWFVADQSSYIGLLEDAQSIYTGFFSSGRFQRGAVYRILEPEDREEGQYYFVQNGAVLANGIFTETMFRQSWDSLADYRTFLEKERVDFVVTESDYFKDFHTNEGQLLDRLVSLELSTVTYRDPEGRFEVYDVRAPLLATGRMGTGWGSGGS